jgi:PAS domain S-box-containing protein
LERAAAPWPRQSGPGLPTFAKDCAEAVAVFVLRPDGAMADLNPAARALLAADGGGRLRAALSDPEALAAARAGLPSMARVALGAGPADPAVALSLLSDGNGLLLGVATPAAASQPRGAAPAEFRRWIDQAPGMMAYVDPAGAVIAANRDFCAHLGWDGEALLGRGLAQLAHPSDAARLTEYLTGVGPGPGHGREATLDLRLLGRDGQQFDVGLLAAAVSTEDGRPGGWCLVLHDAGDRKAVERELEAYTHELEQLYLKLEQRTVELEAANEALRRARVQTLEAEELARIAQMKSAFLDVAAHELRTPVTLLLGLIDCVRRFDPTPLQDSLLANAERSAQRLAGILETALKLLANDQPRFTGRFKRRSLHRLLQAAAGDVQGLLAERDLRLTLDLPAELPLVSIDVSMLRDVVVNLLMNAIKFTRDGGRITVTAGADDRECWFAVRDTGVGIAPEDLPFIFESFFGTLDTSHHSSGHHEFNTRGPGFGLAVVKKFVDHHEGRVEVETAPGAGACFTVRLPLRRPAHGATP